MRVLGSITNRIFLASALLAMLSIGAAVYFVSARMTTQTELELQGGEVGSSSRRDGPSAGTAAGERDGTDARVADELGADRSASVH